MGPAVQNIAGNHYWCTIKILCGAGVVDERGVFLEKIYEGKGFFGKILFGTDGHRHGKLLKCLGIRTFSRMYHDWL